MIKWERKPSGNCPVQAEGHFLGYYFYFRSRGSLAFIEFCYSEEDWKVDHTYQYYQLWTTRWPEAGWLPRWFCYLLIYWGCIRLLFKTDKIKLQ